VVALTGPEYVGKYSYLVSSLSDLINPIDQYEVAHDIDSIKSVHDFLSTAPSMSSYKSIVINDAHLLPETSQEAILKICEEPPDHCKIFLVTCDKFKMLKSLYSRIQEFVDWCLLDDIEMNMFIESFKYEKNKQLLDLSVGRPGLYKIFLNNHEYISFHKRLMEIFANPKLKCPTPDLILKCNDMTIRKIVAFICSRFANNMRLDSDFEIKKSINIHRFASILVSDPAVNAEIYWKRMIAQSASFDQSPLYDRGCV
jgi:hypothetical protein